jgi:transcription elongation factor Elf1
MKYFCPVCGYPELNEIPYDDLGNPSYEICSCCGYEFGFDDNSKNINFDTYRKKWINEGAKWFIPEKKPLEWNLEEQLKNVR